MTTLNNKPSWVGAVLIALAAFPFFALFVGTLADAWMPHVTSGDEEAMYAAYHQRDDFVLSLMLGSGFLLAVFAAVAWRTPVTLRFHITFFSGLSLLAITCAYILRQQELAFQAPSRFEPAFPFLGVPLLAALFIAVALILMLTALYLDRP